MYIKQVKSTGKKLGLEKYGLSVFESATTTLDVPIVKGKVKLTLHEDQLKIIEDYYNVDLDSKEAVQRFKNEILELKHTLTALDPESAPDLLLLGSCITLGIVAPSMIALENSRSSSHFVLVNEGEEEKKKATLYQKYDDAIVEVSKLRKSNKYMIAVARYLYHGRGFIPKDPDTAYMKIREFLDAKKNGDMGRNQSIDYFLNVLSKDKTLLYTTVDYREAVRLNIIRRNVNGQYVNTFSQTELGKNEDEAIQFLMNPKYLSELGTNSSKDLPTSIRYQLKMKE